MSTFVVCGCLNGHRPHDFVAGAFGICSICCHGVGLHKSSSRESAEVADRIARLLRSHEVEDFSITDFGEDGSMRLEVKLVKPTGVVTP